MKTFGKIAALRKFCRDARGPLVLVPTMGALHKGHASLIRRARRFAGPKGTIVVSIFVNPTQFGPREDLSKYPRPLRADLALCKSLGVNAVFRPSPEEIYLEDRCIWVDEEKLSAILCGKSRPGHFRGVCTVVAKLFLIVQPDAAVFGEKDWQQLAILRRMVRDLNFPVRVIAAPTVREADGLAMSSRNRYLAKTDRQNAPMLYKALMAAKALSRAGERKASVLLSSVRKALRKFPSVRIEYIELVDSETLQPLSVIGSRPAMIALAVFFGKTRLIDNIQLTR